MKQERILHKVGRLCTLYCLVGILEIFFYEITFNLLTLYFFFTSDRGCTGRVLWTAKFQVCNIWSYSLKIKHAADGSTSKLKGTVSRATQVYLRESRFVKTQVILRSAWGFQKQPINITCTVFPAFQVAMFWLRQVHKFTSANWLM